MPVDTSKLTEAVTRSTGVAASAISLISGIGERISAAVTAALEADENADQASIDAANAAIEAEVSKLNQSADELAAALTANS